MDWISTTTGCFAVSNAVAKTALGLGRFVRDVRESRADLTALSAELHALDGVLDLLKDDAASASFPADMALQTPAVVAGSGRVVADLDALFETGGEVDDETKQEKRARWLTMRRHVERSRAVLEVYRLTLGLALDLVALTSSPDADDRSDTDASTTASDSVAAADKTTDIARVLAETGHLRARARGDLLVESDAAFILQNYLNVLQRHAHAAMAAAEERSDGDFEDDGEFDDDGGGGHETSATTPSLLLRDSNNNSITLPSPIGKAPDSAVDMDDERQQPSPPLPRPPPPTDEDDDDDLLDELRDELPSRPPTPPPKAVARGSSALGFHDRASIASSAATVRANAAGTGVAGARTRTTATAPPTAPPPMEDYERPFTSLSLSNSNMSTGTSTNSGSGSGGGGGGVAGSNGAGSGGGRFGRFFKHIRSASAAGDVAAAAAAPSPAVKASRRLSASIRSPWAVTTMIQADGGDNSKGGKNSKDKSGDGEPDAVFGVSLHKSIRVAGSSARTHHAGGHGTSSRSRRAFPLCVLTCYNYLREGDGLDTPDLFGLFGGDAEGVHALKSLFAAPPAYGADLADLGAAGFSRHDAAALVLLYLTELPRPLVPEAVARRWVTLSRQATVPGSYAKRLDQCIDFWEEALGGVRGPARSLLKLLLNLWGDVADAADRNDMTAERLAGRVLRPLMHLDGRGRHETDWMLGLAFIIRKRSEYALLLRGGGRKSNAAFDA